MIDPFLLEHASNEAYPFVSSSIGKMLKSFENLVMFSGSINSDFSSKSCKFALKSLTFSESSEKACS